MLNNYIEECIFKLKLSQTYIYFSIKNASHSLLILLLTFMQIFDLNTRQNFDLSTMIQKYDNCLFSVSMQKFDLSTLMQAYSNISILTPTQRFNLSTMMQACDYISIFTAEEFFNLSIMLQVYDN